MGKVDALDFRPRPRWPLDGHGKWGPCKWGRCRIAGMSNAFETVTLFATPVVLSDLPDAAALNADLAAP
jgi:hypothetical protein